jgi:dTDP-4-dehydrorhamnose reductase
MGLQPKLLKIIKFNNLNKKVILTGAHGTIGKVLLQKLMQHGYNVETWDRSKVPIDNYAAMEEYISKVKPDCLFHLAAITSFDPEQRTDSWKVNYEWTSELAWICSQHSVKFIFTSTGMVFSEKQQGPYDINTIPEEDYGYGYEKRMAETQIFRQNPDAVILRLGWQIAEEGRNSILTWLTHTASKVEVMSTSASWMPSCSFVDDSADIIIASVDYPAGIYMVNSNSRWTFYESAFALKDLYKKDWKIMPVKSNLRDRRMIDDRVKIPDLRLRLPFLS